MKHQADFYNARSKSLETTHSVEQIFCKFFKVNKYSTQGSSLGNK